MGAMLTNDLITIEEASVIMQSLSKKDYTNWKEEKNRTIDNELTFYKGNINAVERIQRNFLASQLDATDMFMIGELDLDFGILTTQQNEDGTMESRTYKAGDGWCVPLKTKHRVIATTDYTALECSTAHLNDCIRFEDDSDRGSGKINTEHEGN